MKHQLLMDSKQMELAINRLCHQLIETHKDFSDTVIIGIQKKGVHFAQRMQKKLSEILNKNDILIGDLDITFYRDDFRKKELINSTTHIDFSIEDKNVILIDDIMSPNFKAINLNEDINKAIEIFEETQVWNLAVTDRDEYVGFISKSNIFNKYISVWAKGQKEEI